MKPIRKLIQTQYSSKPIPFFGSVFGIPLITMEYTAGAIYIARNPLDVVISFADHIGVELNDAISLMNDPKGGNNPVKSGKNGYIKQVYGSWSGHVQSWLPLDRRRLFVMRYEDMLDKPIEPFGGMAHFLGLNPPKERLEKAIKFSSFDVVRRQEEEKGFIEQSDKNNKFFRVGKAGQWKEVLSDKQVDAIIKHHYDTMKQFDYLPK